MPAPANVEIIILKPGDTNLKNGTYLSIQVTAMDIAIIYTMVLECFAGGIISAVNMANSAIPMAPLSASGIIPVEHAPRIVPSVHPI